MFRERRKKTPLSPEQSLRRILIHIPAGLVNCLAAYVHWSLALIFGWGFFVYELNEDQHEEDRAYYDILGYLIGLGIGVVVWAIFNLLVGGQ